MLEIKTRGLEHLSRIYKTESKRQEKALNTAIKVEGFRLMRLLKEQIKAGAPGGQKFDPLTFLLYRSIAFSVLHIPRGSLYHRP